MPEHTVTLSHHMLRRTARARAAFLRKHLPALGYGNPIYVQKTKRGPWRWRVVAVGARPGAHDAPRPVAGPEAH